MEPIQIGQRVRVTDGRLVHYRQVGTVVAGGGTGGWYVHLDYDDERPGTRIFFRAEELEPAPEAIPRSRGTPHWSTGAIGMPAEVDRDP